MEFYKEEDGEGQERSGPRKPPTEFWSAIMTPLRLAIIGCGAITESLHLPAARLQDQLVVVALVDVDIAIAKRLAHAFHVPQYAATLDDCENIDAVLLATPPHVRVSLVKQAVEKGYHVIAEKPLGNQAKDCELQIAAAHESRKVFAAAHLYRFWPSRQRIFEVIQSEQYGKVRRIDVSQGKPYSWKSVTGYTMQKELVPGGVLINAGIHPLDCLLWWLGDPTETKYVDDAIGGLESNCLLSMTFEKGREASLRMSRTSELEHFIRIQTSDALIDLPTYARHHFFCRAGIEPRESDLRTGQFDA